MMAWVITRNPSLAEVVRILLSDAGVQCTTFLAARDAVSYLLDEVPGMVIVDDPAQQASDLARLTQRGRDIGKRLHLLLLSDQANQSLVSLARRLSVREILIKPVTPDKLLERVARLWPDSLEPALPETPDAWLHRSRNDMALGMPISEQAVENLPALRSKGVTVEVLDKAWRDEPGIITRLVGAANTSDFNREMTSFDDFPGAISCLGRDHAVTLVQSMAWRRGAVIRDPALQARHKPLVENSRLLARLAVRMAGDVRVDPEACYVAARLAFIGEMSVLTQLQAWCDRGGKLTGEQVDQCLQSHAVPFSHALKKAWRLPMEIRDRAGAVHILPTRQTVSRDRLLLRVAGAAVLQHDKSQVRQELELLGLSRMPEVPA